METIFDENYLPNSNIFVYVDYLFWKFGPDNSLYVGVFFARYTLMYKAAEIAKGT